MKIFYKVVKEEHPLISLFIQKIQKAGKKFTARHIFFKVLKLIEQKNKISSINLVEIAVKNLLVPVLLKTQKIGGSVYQIPISISYSKSIPLAVANLVNYANKKNGISLENSLYTELIDAAKKRGLIWNKRQQFIKQALHNRIFSHLVDFKKKFKSNKKISMKYMLVANQQQILEQKFLENKYKNLNIF